MTSSLKNNSDDQIRPEIIGGIIFIIGLIRFFLGIFPHNLEVLYLLWLGIIIGAWRYIKPKKFSQKIAKFALSFIPLFSLFWFSFYLDDIYDLSSDLYLPQEVKEEMLPISFNAINAEKISINSTEETVEGDRVNTSIKLNSGENKIKMTLTNKIGEKLVENFRVFYVSPEIEEQRKQEETKLEAEKIAKEEEEKKKRYQQKIKEYERLAGICSQTYVEAMIAPRPADFPIKNATFDEERKLFRISSYVDTVNDFNAPIRKRYYCEIAGVDLDSFTCKQHNCQWEE